PVPADPCRASRSRAVPGAHHDDGVLPVEILHQNVHPVSIRDRERLAHDVGAYGQLAPAAIHEHREPNARGTAEVGELVERRANGAAGVQDIVHDDHMLGADVPGDIGWTDHGTRPDGLQIVAIERDVERATRDVHVLALLHHGGETIGELHAAALDANEHEAVGAIIELDDLVCHAAERAIHGPRIEHGGGGRGHGGEIYATGAGRGEGVVP